jgi:hypothetical protein
MSLIRLTQQYGLDHGILLEVSEIAALVPLQDRADIAKCSRSELQGWALCLAQRAVLMRGIVPDGWDKTAHCHFCGWIFSYHDLNCCNCEWCHVREAGKPFPQPKLRN